MWLPCQKAEPTVSAGGGWDLNFRWRPTCERLAHCHRVGGIYAPSSVVADRGDNMVVSKIWCIVARLIDSCQWNVNSIDNFKTNLCCGNLGQSSFAHGIGGSGLCPDNFPKYHFLCTTNVKRSVQSLSTCAIGVVVGNHPTPGSITDRPEVGVKWGHAGREAREVISVKLPRTALWCGGLDISQNFWLSIPALAWPRNPTCSMSLLPGRHVEVLPAPRFA